jgi:hypothetical protein
MASTEEIAALRLLINGDVIDAAGSLNAAAGQAWVQKASSYAEVVDVAESGSSRKLSDLHKHALTMSDHYTSLAGGGATVTGPVIHRIRRTLP